MLGSGGVDCGAGVSHLVLDPFARLSGGATFFIGIDSLSPSPSSAGVANTSILLDSKHHHGGS